MTRVKLIFHITFLFPDVEPILDPKACCEFFLDRNCHVNIGEKNSCNLILGSFRVSVVNRSELLWLRGSENCKAFSLKLADATRFIFGTKSDEQPCTHPQYGPIFHHINCQSIQEKVALMFDYTDQQTHFLKT